MNVLTTREGSYLDAREATYIEPVGRPGHWDVQSVPRCPACPDVPGHSSRLPSLSLGGVPRLSRLVRPLVVTKRRGEMGWGRECKRDLIGFKSSCWDYLTDLQLKSVLESTLKVYKSSLQLSNKSRLNEPD